MDETVSVPTADIARKRVASAAGLPAVVAAVAIIIVTLFPAVAPSKFYTNLATEMLIYGLWALSLDVLIGYVGLVSFGHAAYFGLGVYGTGLLLKKAGISIAPAMAGGVVLSLVAALLVGFVIVRLSGIAFAMLTLAFAQMFFTVVWRWSSLTGGDDGISVPRPDLEVWGQVVSLQSSTAYYYFVVAMVMVIYALIYRAVNSPVGAALQAIRENETRAECIGFAVQRYKLIAFAIAGTVAGIAGSLLVMFKGFAAPSLMHWSASGSVLMMAILGGTGTLYGPLAGAALMVFAQDYLSSYTEHWMLPLGLLFIFVVRYFRGGLAGLIGNVLGRP